MSNYKAIQMHMIDNGFSMERRRDNWKQFLSKITEITTRIEDVDILVTGDKDFSDIDIEKPEIMSPAQFMERFL